MGVFRNILSAIDFDDNSFAALNLAATLARQSEARLHLLHVVSVAVPCLPADVDLYLNRGRTAQEKLIAVAAECLRELDHEVLTRVGDPAVGILDCAAEIKADLIVIATYSSRGAAHEFRGSIAERLLREAQCPVLAMRGGFDGDIESVRTQMTKDPVSVAPDASLAEVRAKLRGGGFRFMPVVEEGRLLGVITDRDVRLYSAQAADIEVGSVMTREVVTVSPRASIREVARLLVECDVGGFPVVEGQRLVGVITTTDVLKALTR